ncbi:nucleotidyl transferase AbiEii/AbiGii toxin family protein [Catelliglobosispora koreensis]|uniref:nucleotidyl transferase AbiEii/AbiGii toxin family protein n=1 Tax=Catelliglobosispora koreensis TaxID=129052 RepID=UPI0003694E1C|nr:nucleotidyl transferase AbiEii/AbiGii toxin family protein [Catelliglobosispora koreensis]
MSVVKGESPFGLSHDELAREAARFGVSDEQVQRDHAISHILASISEQCRDDVIFFGGTALSRTHLLHARLSEDIDLLALAPRGELADRLAKVISQGLLRTHGRISWNPGFAIRDDAQAAIMETPSGIAVKIQLLANEGYSRWPVEERPVEQRYRDARPASLVVPTMSSFVGWKTDAWLGRQAPRDLYDLWALSELGAINASAVDAFVRYGPTGRPPREFMFAKAPTHEAWIAALGSQTRIEVGPSEALAAVRAAWAKALNEDWAQDSFVDGPSGANT